jgi:prepilin-type N-terminal cleavage/methylation domain-containing protein
MGKLNLFKDEAGFTLIEIIAVLVIMGILAAVAVPKFFDLQSKASEKAAFSASAELKMRVKQYFAAELIEGYTWGSAGRMTWSATAVGTNLGDDFTVTEWTVSGASGKPSKTTGSITVKIMYEDPYSPTEYTKIIDLPRYSD